LIRNLLAIKFSLYNIKFLKRVGKIWHPYFSLDELVKYLYISNLARYCESFLIHSPLCVIIIHCIKRKIRRIWKVMFWEKQEANNHNTSPSFTSFAMNRYSGIFTARNFRKFVLELWSWIKRFILVMLCQKKLCINAKVEYCSKSAYVMIRKRKTLELKMWHLLTCILFAFFDAKIVNFYFFR
jgi:hypothetical protein